MKYYVGIDLHSNNNVIVVLDEQDHVVGQTRLPNQLERVVRYLSAYADRIEGIAVESTFNWYWLVDGLMEAGYRLHLVNTAAVQKYSGLKYSDDKDDARWLAHLLRLGILPTGYIYPKEARGVRDLLRKRSQLVRQRSTQILSIESLLSRHLGQRSNANAIKRWTPEDVERLPLGPEARLAVDSHRVVFQCIDAEIHRLEKVILERMSECPAYRQLQTVSGVGKILSLTIAIETGDIHRFPGVGNFASYCRCVGSQHLSNGKQKGVGNTKNGNRYLAWAFVEAAHFAVRYDETIKRYYERKRTQTHPVVAIKTVAHKLARACYHVMRDGVDFETKRAFA
jgi:transposase